MHACVSILVLLCVHVFSCATSLMTQNSSRNALFSINTIGVRTRLQTYTVFSQIVILKKTADLLTRTPFGPAGPTGPGNPWKARANLHLSNLAGLQGHI